MGLAPTGGDISPSAPNGRHDAQLFCDFIERSCFRESLKSVDNRLLVSHGERLLLLNSESKRRSECASKKLMQCAQMDETCQRQSLSRWKIHRFFGQLFEGFWHMKKLQSFTLGQSSAPSSSAEFTD